MDDNSNITAYESTPALLKGTSLNRKRAWHMWQALPSTNHGNGIFRLVCLVVTLGDTESDE